MKQLGRLLSVITWLLILGGIVIISGGLLGRPLLVAAVPTTSMVPVLRPGDLIVVLPTWTVAHPGLGDIVVFKTDEDRSWIVHRIVDGNAAEGFITKGDANPISDPVRVFPRDMAGVVPQWGGSAVRLPRLGDLRIESGPLSSPVIAGVALVLGVFLLLADMQPVRVPRVRHGRRHRARPDAILYVYLGLAGTAFITTLIPAWTLSSEQLVAYDIAESRTAGTQPRAKYLQGEVHQEYVTVENPSPLPLLVVYATDAPGLTYTPWSALIPAKGSVVFDARITNEELGHHEGSLKMAVLLPLLPPALLAAVASKSMILAATLTALVPALAVIALGFTDPRVRLALLQVRARAILRYSHS
ncbi:MAG: peptidase signal peptidase [Symbiobacteriaceae bacterium]|jgi:signal peptidase|nr:peptidase signal peptidase [Symbiobacteriaceae bacterium]